MTRTGSFRIAHFIRPNKLNQRLPAAADLIPYNQSAAFLAPTPTKLIGAKRENPNDRPAK
jgi:hypothetical protein